MKEGKKHSIPVAKRAAATSRSIAPPADLAKRVSDCETEIRALRAEVLALRAALTGRARKLPPPLPMEAADDVIAVDASEVILESIRPPKSSRPGRM
jgi:hypothetical protein